MQNHANLAAEAAQAALDSVSQSGKGAPSDAAMEARNLAKKAADTWQTALDYAEQAKNDAAHARREIRTLNKVVRRGSRAYSTAINRVQIPAPIFPGNIGAK